MRRFVIITGALLLIAVGTGGIALQIANRTRTGAALDPVRFVMSMFPAVMGILLLLKRRG